MTRLQTSDLIASTYIANLQAAGLSDSAERVQKVYEVQRVEIIANEEVRDEGK